MKSRTRVLALAASAPLALTALAAPAFAQSSGSQTYTATLSPVPLNGQTSASGTFSMTLNGDVATIHETATGLASTFMGKPYPHVQHIHGGAQGTCPTSSADTNHDGVISTTEGQASYGPIETTLSVGSGSTSASAGTDISIAPSGSSFTYDRTITLDSTTMASLQKGIAVIVVHGLNPATAPKAASTEKSDLVSSLPLAATSPALCGVVTASQMSTTPSGAAATGGGSTSGLQDGGLLAVGAAGLVGAAGVMTYRRRVGQH